MGKQWGRGDDTMLAATRAVTIRQIPIKNLLSVYLPGILLTPLRAELYARRVMIGYRR